MEISVNQSHFFEAKPDLSILESAKKASLTLDHSCLSGRCSECKVKVVSGDFDMPNTQEGLSEKEVQEGYCLSCITKPLSDMELEEVNFIEGVFPEVKIIPAKISSLDFLSADVAKLSLRIPPNKFLDFIPGQYINLSIRNIKRSYSISSIPSDSIIELFIKKYQLGKFSYYLFNEAKVNDLLRIEGPNGTYILPKTLPRSIIFISTGTGIAPNLSLIRSAIRDRKINKNRITVIHGQRYAHEHIYQLEKILPGIKIIKVISREHKIGFTKGYVQDQIIKLDLPINENLIFACGNSQMIKELYSQLSSMGLCNRNFKADYFVPSS